MIETRAFAERLEQAIGRYHAIAIATAEVLQKLIKLAHDIRAARKRGGELGLPDEEISFYDALTENESALQVVGDDKLRVIAHELLVSLREKVAVDWTHCESPPRSTARAGQAHPGQVRLPAGPAGYNGSNSAPADRGVIGGSAGGLKVFCKGGSPEYLVFYCQQC